MKWSFKQPEAGDMIRVKLQNNVYHYGIYVSDQEIIQFGLNPVLNALTPSEQIEVCATDVDAFICGGFLECAELDKKQKKLRLPPQKTVQTAQSRLGERGYNIIHNNCEHFANECVFGKKESLQAKSVRDYFASIPIVDVYVAKTDDKPFEPLFPPLRQAELDGVSNQRIKREKYCVWKLLEYAAYRTFGFGMREIAFTKSKNGKWRADKFEFSLSHGDGVVAVAVSKAPVGVDLERIKQMPSSIENKILTKQERLEFDALTEQEKNGYLIKAWTQKEAFFKRLDQKSWSPSKLELKKDELFSKVVRIGQEDTFVLSVATKTPDKVRIIEHSL